MTEPLSVLLVTSWGTTGCGIEEHSRMLKEAVEAADPLIRILPTADALDPLHDEIRSVIHDGSITGIDLVHLNYQASLHSRWTPEHVRVMQESGHPVLITYHDTGVPNSDQCRALHAVADAFVIHEPAEDLPGAIYWRMGVPAAPRLPTYPSKEDGRPLGLWSRPVLGTVGFPFGWKNYDELARVTAANGWGLLLIAPNATPEDQSRWHMLNPVIRVFPAFLPQASVLSLLAGCDATAFTYVCHNTGQSGALLQGIAARKPVIALSTCRQFRALYADPLGNESIWWAETFEEVGSHLRHMQIQSVDPGIVALAEQESWTKLGAKYAALYRSLL